MSFLFSRKCLSGLLLLCLVGCQSIKTRDDIRQPTPAPKPPRVSPQHPEAASDVSRVEVPDDSDEEGQITMPPPAPVIPALPKIGIILGAGGAKAYAHVGFLQELARAKVPVYAIAGVEFAAPMAALYANRELANDVEWQMFKLKDEEVIKKSLLGGVNKNSEVTVLKEFFATAFAKQKAESFGIPFACPSYSLKKNQTFLMNRGSLDQVLSMCMAYPPFFKPFQGQISGVRDISATAQYLRKKGANFIVFVNVLQAPGGTKSYTMDASATDNVLWSEIAGLYNKPFAGVDSVVSLANSSYGIMDFEKRREIMGKGADQSSKLLKDLTKKWGL